MADSTKNRIHDATLDFGFQTLRSEALRGNELVDWAKVHILEAIDQHAVSLTEAQTIVQIPELKIALQLEVGSDFFKEREAWSEAISGQIQMALKKAISENKTAKISMRHYKANSILEYIKSGQVVRYANDEDWKADSNAFLEELLDNSALRSEWLRAIRSKDGFLRFYTLKDIPALIVFIEKWTGEKRISERLAAVLKLMGYNPKYFTPIRQIELYYTIFLLLPTTEMSLNPTLQKIILKALLSDRVVLASLTLPKEIEREITALGFDDLLQRDVDTAKGEEETPKEDLPEVLDAGAYVGQAGLVLLASFLPAFLKNAGYLDKKGKLLKQLQVPILLHYMATGETTAPEWKLTLPKVLAGLRPGQHCRTGLNPTKKLDTQIDELLTAVIEHWAALKNTSPEGLRTTFLTREGALKFRNGFYYLYINEQTVDILLSYVSWNYMTLKLDWMQHVLLVEWNKT